MIEDKANPPRKEHAYVNGDGQLIAHRARERLRADDEEDHAEHRVEGVEVAEHDAQQIRLGELRDELSRVEDAIVFLEQQVRRYSTVLRTCARTGRPSHGHFPAGWSLWQCA